MAASSASGGATGSAQAYDLSPAEQLAIWRLQRDFFVSAACGAVGAPVGVWGGLRLAFGAPRLARLSAVTKSAAFVGVGVLGGVGAGFWTLQAHLDRLINDYPRSPFTKELLSAFVLTTPREAPQPNPSSPSK